MTYEQEVMSQVNLRYYAIAVLREKNSRRSPNIWHHA
jgi:hypothetical protein